MKNSIVKDILKGVALALVAAYLYPVVFLLFLDGPRGLLLLFSIIPFIGLLYSFWLVIPLGAALGLLIPRMAYGKTLWAATLQGALFGAAGGLVSFFCLINAHGLRFSTLVMISVAAYCALWTGVYAFIRAQRDNIYR